MSYAVGAVLVVHGLFILYVLLGGVLVFYSKRMLWPHLVTVAWGMWIELFGGTCPLTILEWKLRRRFRHAAIPGWLHRSLLDACHLSEWIESRNSALARPDPDQLERGRVSVRDSLLAPTSARRG